MRPNQTHTLWIWKSYCMKQLWPTLEVLTLLVHLFLYIGCHFSSSQSLMGLWEMFKKILGQFPSVWLVWGGYGGKMRLLLELLRCGYSRILCLKVLVFFSTMTPSGIDNLQFECIEYCFVELFQFLPKSQKPIVLSKILRARYRQALFCDASSITRISSKCLHDASIRDENLWRIKRQLQCVISRCVVVLTYKVPICWHDSKSNSPDSFFFTFLIGFLYVTLFFYKVLLSCFPVIDPLRFWLDLMFL